MKNTELIVRGVCVKNGHILLCQNKNKTHSYLPGGHIEHRERAAEALAREIKEELGVTARVERFLGCAEFCFRQKKQLTVEINLLFQTALPRVTPRKNPVAKERHLRFFWQPMSTLATSNLQPEILRTLLPQWRQYPGFSSSGEGWKKY